MKPVYVFVGEKQKYLCSVSHGDISFDDVCVSLGEVKRAMGGYIRGVPDATRGTVKINLPYNRWRVLRRCCPDPLPPLPRSDWFSVVLDTPGALVKLECYLANEPDIPDILDGYESITAELEFFAHPEFFDDFFDMWRAEKLTRLEMNSERSY